MKILPSFTPTGHEWDDFTAKDRVRVVPKYMKLPVSHEFIGEVIDKNVICVVVKNQKGECFIVEADQVSHIHE